MLRSHRGRKRVFKRPLPVNSLCKCANMHVSGVQVQNSRKCASIRKFLSLRPKHAAIGLTVKVKASGQFIT